MKKRDAKREVADIGRLHAIETIGNMIENFERDIYRFCEAGYSRKKMIEITDTKSKKLMKDIKAIAKVAG